MNHIARNPIAILTSAINCSKSIGLLNGATFSHPSTPLRVLLRSSSLSGVEGCGEHVNTFGTINLTGAIKSTILCVLLLVSDSSLADTRIVVPDIMIPEFNQYNRSINFGSEISRDVQYKNMPSDKLVVGVLSPDMNNWESHSTVTTSLFSIDASIKKNVVFYAKSFGMAQKQSVLWVSIRYFDEHGVFIDSTGGDTFDVPNHWQEISLPLTSNKQESVYAEVWFVKYEDADKTGGTIHPIYLSGITVK